MSLTFNTKTYTADSFASDQVGFIGAAKTVSIKDDLSLARQRPKASAVYSGNGRTRTKLTRTATLTGAITPSGDLLAEFNVQVPVGAAGADVDALLNDLGALISSADFKLYVKNQKINF